MSRIRIAISGQQGTGKSQIADMLAFYLQEYSSRQIKVDGERYLLADQEPDLRVPDHVQEVEIDTFIEMPCDFADNIVGQVSAKRFRDADPEVAHHVRRLLEVGLLPAPVAERILIKSGARGTPK
jgi:energy-coupling factor transporter ATP-binding protein EcfA2